MMNDMNYTQLFDNRLNGVSTITKKNYMVYIRELDKQCHNKELSVAELYIVMNRMIDAYDKAGACGGLMARSAFIKMLKFLDIPPYEADDALINVRVPERKTLKKYVSFSVLKKIINNAPTLELKLNMMTQYETCSRIEDVLNLKAENIDFEDKVIRMHTLKTGVSKINAISDHTLQLLNGYVNDAGLAPEDYVFKMKYWSVWDHERKIVLDLKNRGLIGNDDVKFSSHWLRASRAVHLYQKRVDLEAIQREGGWKSVESLLKYLKMSGLDAKQTQKKCKPEW